MLERSGRRLFQAQAMADCIPPLSIALEVQERLGAPDPVVGELSYMLVVAGWQADREVGSRHVERPLEIYAHLAGIGTADRLRRWIGLRLALLLGLLWAGLRWLLRWGRARGPNPVRAMAYFALTLANATAIAYAGNQKERVRGLVARAAPFAAFKGTTPFAAFLMLHAMTDILEGRLSSARARLTEAIRLTERPFLNPLGETERKLTAASGRAIRMIVDVNQFDPRLHKDLSALDGSGFTSYHHSADTFRVVHLRYRGQESTARSLEAAIEPTSLQLNSWSVDLSRLLFAHPAYALTHDVEGLKRCLDALQRRVAEGMKLSDRVEVTRAELHRERGEFDEALALLEPLLERLDPDDHLMRQFAASAAAQAALESYRYDLAARYAELGVDDGSDPAVRVLLPWLRCQRVLGLAEDALGRSQEATVRLDRAIELAEARDCPVLAGELHEARARVAFANRDRLLFEVHRAKCAAWLRPTENPGLIAVVERLVELDRLERDTSLPEPDARRRRPGASTETSGGASTETSATSEVSAEPDPDAVPTASALGPRGTDNETTTPWERRAASTAKPHLEADAATMASSPRALRDSEEQKTEASSPRALRGTEEQQTAASSPSALARSDEEEP
jgi:tetratricopeptide (TPR) repeat protein